MHEGGHRSDGSSCQPEAHNKEFAKVGEVIFVCMVGRFRAVHHSSDMGMRMKMGSAAIVNKCYVHIRFNIDFMKL